jgi:23S rRNA (guanosine2251-2'-O)-methyltransferase
MYKAASGAMEHINIFEVSNINSTLKNLKKKIFGFMVLMEKVIKILLILNGKEILFFYLDLRVLV